MSDNVIVQRDSLPKIIQNNYILNINKTFYQYKTKYYLPFCLAYDKSRVVNLK
jgi:hypothetical protein